MILSPARFRETCRDGVRKGLEETAIRGILFVKMAP
jgi:hypothetical protein